MPCDSGRPCLRCIKKGLQDTCEDAPRKRKKYLVDVPGTLIMANPDPPVLRPPQVPELLFDMESTQSIKTEPDFGSGPRPGPDIQNYEATPFQTSSSLPDFLLRNKVHPIALSESTNNQQNSPSLFSTHRYDTGYFLDPTMPSRQGLISGQNRHFNIQPKQPVFDGLQRPSNVFTGQENTNGSSKSDLHTEGHKKYQGKNTSVRASSEKKKKPNFLSSAADLEYATLSNILQDSFMGFNQTHPLTSTEGTPASTNMSPGLSPRGYNDISKVSPSSSLTAASRVPNNFLPNSLIPDDQSFGSTGFQVQYQNTSEFPPFDARINQYFLGDTMHFSNVRFPEVSEAMEIIKQNNPAMYYTRNSKLSLSLTMGFARTLDKCRNLRFTDPEEIYAKIKKPFSYTPGFHKLIAYLRGRFPREMLVEMAESMAVYRPSFIACTNSLRESDLIFMEQCFQRTLLTYDNFIKVSGTPTIVWRRTGEIAYVGHEFTALTGWTQEQLLSGEPTFIVELLDDKSVVEYFQLFSKIAFGDFLGATMTECTLLTPKENVKIRAGCSWTMKRDVFGIPMMIIGNFLPIL